MKKDEVLALDLSAKQKAQAERCFTAWDRTNAPNAFAKLSDELEVKKLLDKYLYKYESNKKAKEGLPKKKTARDIQALAVQLCKGSKKKMTFDELYEIILGSVKAKQLKAIDAKRAKLEAELEALATEAAELA